MGHFLLRRGLLSILALFGVLVVMYVLMQSAPVDPARQYAGPHASAQDLARVSEELGLDRPMPVQIAVYIRNFFTGRWGESLATKQPVLEGVGSSLPFTLELVGISVILLMCVGIPLGVISAAKKDRWPDHLSRIFAVGLISIPTFWLALGLQYALSGQLHLLPLSGSGSYLILVGDPITKVTGFPLFDALVTGNFTAFSDHLAHLVLPVIALTGMALAGVQRLTRAGMVDILGEDYIIASRSYGLSERTVLWRLGLKNALGPVATIVALMFAYLLVNTFLIESIFGWPGIGMYIAQAVSSLDYPVIMAVTLVSAVAFLTLNFIADIVIALDPRVRIQA